MIFRAGKHQFTFPRQTLLMGIVNVTPDSFSDGGRFASADAAIEHAMELVRQGADIIDVGGESTRPRATPVPADEELRRVLPVVEVLAAEANVPISIDTMKTCVAEAAVRAGASIINDVGANRVGKEMNRLVAETGAGYVLMHMQGTPQTMQQDPRYKDVVAEVKEFFVERMERLWAAGVDREHVILDVGIGFGKTAGHNLQLLRGLRAFTNLGQPVLLGVSRKSFMGQLSGATVMERLPAALACSCWAVEQGVQIIRTHDVAETRRAVGMMERLLEE